mgnify:CR=1 FL=1
MKLFETIRKVIAKPIMEAVITEILDEAVSLGKITNEQKNLIIEVGAELGKIKLKK